jgi:RimJ/RimL family protein N-acetyltransferase
VGEAGEQAARFEDVKCDEMQTTPRIRVRSSVSADAEPLCELLNEIIRVGGTTAYETPFSVSGFIESFLQGPDFICCFVAEDAITGTVAGFQSLERIDDLPQGWADIGTFARTWPKVPGVGTALFAATRTTASDLGLVAINAAIRADNLGGLAFYEKMGFRTYATLPKVPLKDGTPVDRILKRYDVET